MLALATLLAAVATADAHVSLAIEIPPPPVAGRPFSVDVGVGNAGPDRTRFTLHVELPPGLRAVGGALEGSFDAPPGFESSFALTLAARAPGSYTIRARVDDLSVPDPDPENNEVGLGVAVVAPPLVPWRFTLTPARPRAGGRLTASFQVLNKLTGRSVTPSRVSCRASVGKTRTSFARGKAICFVRTPSSASGRTLDGVLRATAFGVPVEKAFAVRLR